MNIARSLQRRISRARALVVVAVVAIGSIGLTAPAGAAVAPAHYYLSLGDSLSVGIQPLGADGANITTDDAYPIKLLPLLQRRAPGLQLQQVGCPGATAATVLDGGDAYDCHYAGGTQLSVALAFIRTHPVDALTINLGSNDVISGCVSDAGIDETCVRGAIAALPTTLGSILDQLNEALPATAARSGMTYYDPYLGAYPVAPELAALSVGLTNTLNNTLRAVYRSRGFAVAQVAFLYALNVHRPVGNPPVPLSVVQTCALTWYCNAGNIHPNAAGYAKIAEAFAWSLRTGR